MGKFHGTPATEIMRKFYGTPDQFIDLLSGLPVTWLSSLFDSAGIVPTKGPQVYTFRTLTGGIVNWWPSTGTIQVQGPEEDRNHLEMVLKRALSFVEPQDKPKEESASNQASAFIFLTTTAGRVALRRRSEYVIMEASKFHLTDGTGIRSVVFTALTPEPLYVLEPVEEIVALLEAQK